MISTLSLATGMSSADLGAGHLSIAPSKAVVVPHVSSVPTSPSSHTADCSWTLSLREDSTMPQTDPNVVFACSAETNFYAGFTFPILTYVPDIMHSLIF